MSRAMDFFKNVSLTQEEYIRKPQIPLDSGVFLNPKSE
jgi:hypothetical protein